MAPMISKDTVTRLIPIIFFCVLYSISIVFLVYVHCYLLKNVGKPIKGPPKQIIYPVAVYSVSNDMNRDSQPKNISSDEDDSETTPEADDKPRDGYDHVMFQEPSDTPIPRVTVFHHGEASYPNFYLRVGAVVFGAGTMLYCGLNIASQAHDITCGNANSLLYGLLVVQTLLFLFTFYQLYFVFKHNKISINVHKPLSRFGLMHMVATNACNWFLILLMEAEHGFAHVDDEHSTHTTVAPGHTEGHANTTGPCDENVMEPILMSLQPYLFPCIIEYSLIMAASVYQMGENIGIHETILRRRATRLQEDPAGHAHIPLTCYKSYHGLFTGIAFLILTAIDIVIYNVLVTKDHLKETAAILYFSMEFAILCILLVTTIIAWLLIQNLAFDDETLKGLDAALLRMSLLGVLLFDAFCILFAVYDTVIYSAVMGVLRPVISSVQSAAQTVFIFDGGHRFTNTTELCKRKPGRELVIFMLMLNMCLWGMYTFQARTLFNDHSFHSLYDKPSWIIITHLTIPLSIFFRFHSTTCLYEIWKHGYTKQKQR
ncbi:proton channel OtopLc-like isoform X2 [Lineus longissimus]